MSLTSKEVKFSLLNGFEAALRLSQDSYFRITVQ